MAFIGKKKKKKERKKASLERIFGKMLDRLSSKPRIGGLQITNGGLEYVFSEARPPRAFSVKFPVGALRDGRMQKREDFVAVAKKLHELADTEKKRKPIQVVVSLPAAAVYTQSFSVPNIDEERLEESAALNLQMLSPVPKDEAYLSFEVLNETQDKFELLGAFVEKKIVDDFRVALVESGFFPIAFEFPSRSLTRLIAKVSPQDGKPSLAMHVSSDGIDFFIVRNGALLFDYFRSWTSIQGSETAIQKDLFLSTIVSETQKVANFVLSHYKERLEKVHLMAPAMMNEIQGALTEKIGVSVQLLTLEDSALPAAWYVPLGASEREFKDGTREAVNLNNESARDIFFQEHSLSFLYFWRRLAGSVAVLFIAAFLLAYSFLEGQLGSLENQLQNSRAEADARELSTLKEKAESFNAIVADLGREPRKLNEWKTVLSEIGEAAKAGGVTVDRIGIISFSSPVAMIARAPDNSATLAFKTALSSRKGFSQVDVPLLSIHELEDGSVGFNVSFIVDPSALQSK